MIQFRGIEFRGVDKRLMALKRGPSSADGVAMFGPDASAAAERGAAQEGDLVERGSFGRRRT